VTVKGAVCRHATVSFVALKTEVLRAGKSYSDRSADAFRMMISRSCPFWLLDACSVLNEPTQASAKVTATRDHT
jgi:hypothetical protein